jgi:5-methylcytosine-specific restriction protein B
VVTATERDTVPSPFDDLIGIIQGNALDSWKKANEQALAALFGTRYPKRAEKSVTLRAPDMNRGEAGIPYAAYIHPANPDSGAYGGMSFVVFPVEGGPCLIGMVIGTQGLSPDEAILGRPGHARRMQAVCAWLNRAFGNGELVAWAKHDPTRIDVSVPDEIRKSWSEYEKVFGRYGGVLYALYRPNVNREATLAALTAMLDCMFEERGFRPLKEFEDDYHQIQSAWFSRLMPLTTPEAVIQLLHQRRYAILQGPPGTGKTRMARQILQSAYSGFGNSVQFHPNTTYENFIGGLAPITDHNGSASLGFRFAPAPGFLMQAAKAAAENPQRHYLLHIDEINRADLGKILGEAIYLLEPHPESPRSIDLAYDFGPPFHRRLHLPDNLHILGTMNSADRSIAIVDVAVRRRFGFLSLWPDATAIAQHGCPLTLLAFERLTSIFVEHAPEDALALVPGHSYFLTSDSSQAKINLQTNLAPLLTEYLAQGYVSGFAEPIRSYLQWLESL